MKAVCCAELWTAMISRELEWVSDGEIVVGRWTSWGLLPLFVCPHCGADV